MIPWEVAVIAVAGTALVTWAVTRGAFEEADRDARQAWKQVGVAEHNTRRMRDNIARYQAIHDERPWYLPTVPHGRFVATPNLDVRKIRAILRTMRRQRQNGKSDHP